MNEIRDNNVENVIRRSILRRIMIDGSFVISDISEDSGYSVTTVAKYLSRMIEDGDIEEVDKVSLHSRGRRTARYGVPLGRYYFLGADVRAFEFSVGVIDIAGNILKIETDKNFRFENTYDVLDSICDRIKAFAEGLEGIDSRNIAALNINLSGRVNSSKGTSSTIFNFEETANTPLAEVISERLGMPVFLENDTKAMTYGEYMSGDNRKYSNMCYVNIGWGLGLGIIINGELYYGKDGYSGEFGHVHIYDNNVLCHCGKKGCLETEVSSRAIIRKLTERILAGETSLLSQKIRSGATVTTDDVISAIEKEDAMCIELISEAGTELGHRLAGLINILNPEIIIIGGNLSNVESCYFLQYVKLAVRQYSLKLMSQDVPIVTSSLGSNAAIVGACLIARSKILNSGTI